MSFVCVSNLTTTYPYPYPYNWFKLKPLTLTLELTPWFQMCLSNATCTATQWYLDMVPSALVPAVKIDGEVVTESRDILLAIEAAFPESDGYTPLLPSAGLGRSRRLERARVVGACTSCWLNIKLART